MRKIALTVIRPATPADIPVLQRLAEATWWATYRNIISDAQIEYMLDLMYSAEALEAQMVVLGHRFLLARHGGRYAGFASYGLRDPRSSVFRLHKLYVRPECQGTGLGHKLIRALEDDARQCGARRVELNVNRANPAQHFYYRHGYRVQQVLDIPLGPFWLNDYVMSHDL
ncbi:MAG: GNAT family N-acetyltransferase [Hymenobacteraceae bacterium]|nr:GNAT family N-acetyltransferase [Hymenobacteraceae bacterium]